MRYLGALAVLVVLGLATLGWARSRSYAAPKPKTTTVHRSPRTKCLHCPRDARGNIKRSPKARNDFRKRNPCPSTSKTTGPCPGYVIDHVKPLKRGGADTPSNMQWQTTAAAKAKDSVE